MAHPRDGSERRTTDNPLYQGWLWPAPWEHHGSPPQPKYRSSARRRSTGLAPIARGLL